MKLPPVGAEFFHADRRTDRRNEANSRFSQFCETAYKLRVCFSYFKCMILPANFPLFAVITLKLRWG
jgi:hypothetical protein